MRSRHDRAGGRAVLHARALISRTNQPSHDARIEDSHRIPFHSIPIVSFRRVASGRRKFKPNPTVAPDVTRQRDAATVCARRAANARRTKFARRVRVHERLSRPRRRHRGRFRGRSGMASKSQLRRILASERAVVAVERPHGCRRHAVRRRAPRGDRGGAEFGEPRRARGLGGRVCGLSQRRRVRSAMERFNEWEHRRVGWTRSTSRWTSGTRGGDDERCGLGEVERRRARVEWIGGGKARSGKVFVEDARGGDDVRAVERMDDVGIVF